MAKSFCQSQFTDLNHKRYNRKGKSVEYCVKNRVVFKTHTLSDAEKGINAKLAPLYEGPYTIKEVKSENIYIFDMGNSKRMDEAHVFEVRKYRESRRRLQPN